MPDRLQRQRFEFKYLISEHVALGVRDFVSSYLELDEYGGSQPNLSYPVHTLYLDSPDLMLYRSTINGDRNRFKLRVRFYENADDRPVYFEIKRRANNAIHKKRAAVHRSAARDILGGHVPHPSHLVDDRPETLEALDAFTTVLKRLDAVPQVHVSYLREAWMADGVNSVRVTMDREVRTECRRIFSFDPRMAEPTEVFGSHVVLELKFTDRFPNWFGELVRVFGIRQQSAAKYADGIQRMGEHAFYL